MPAAFATIAILIDQAQSIVAKPLPLIRSAAKDSIHESGYKYVGEFG